MRCSRLIVARCIVAFLLISGLCNRSAWAQVRYTVTDLGTLGGAMSAATALNNLGQVVGYSLTADNSQDAFLYRNGVLNDISTPALELLVDRATGINDSGDVVGYRQFDIPTGFQGFLYHNNTLSLLQTLAGGHQSMAWGINNSGQIAGAILYGSDILTGHVTIWTNGIPTDYKNQIDPLGFDSSAFSAINASGQAAGTDGRIGVIWQNNSASFYRCTLTSINDQGQAVGTDINDGIGGYIVQNQVVTPLNAPAGFAVWPHSINNLSQIVGTMSSASGFRAFLYTDNFATDLNTLIPPNNGWTLTDAAAINNYGEITGTGTINGQSHAYLLTPIDTHLSSNSVVLTADYQGGSTVDGIVCDNLPHMDPSLLDRLKITVQGYDQADFSDSRLYGDSPGRLDTTQPGVLCYYPPDEFNVNQTPNGVGDLTKEATRQVTLAIRFKSGGQCYTVDPKQIILARTPVVLVHGINSSPSAWFDLLKGIQVDLGIRIPFAFVDHSDVLNGNGPVELGAFRLANTIGDTLTRIRTGQPLPNGSVSQETIFLPNGPAEIFPQDPFTDYSAYNFPDPNGLHLAIRRVDVVGWSYGGMITRWFIASDGSDPSNHNDPGKSWYKRIYGITSPTIPTYDNAIRKFFTLGSMWRGVPLVNYLNEVAFKAYPSPSGIYLGEAPVISNPLTALGETVSGIHSLEQLADFLDANTALKVFAPSMEVMAVNSPWQTYLLTTALFNPSVSYGSVAGDNAAYLGIDDLDLIAPYAAIDLAQRPSWFPFLRLEHSPGASRNYTDGLIPLWSSAIPGSYKIAPTNHHDYPKDPDTQSYLAQWLNNSNLPTGADLQKLWNTSVTSYDQSKVWTFSPGEMAPHSQNILYPQIGGIGRINPSALQGNNDNKPVIKVTRDGMPTFTNVMSFSLAVSNTGAPANGFVITSISFYQTLLGPKLPYTVLGYPPPIDFLGPPQELTFNVISLTGFATSPLFCTVNYQYHDQKGNSIAGSTASIRLK